MADTQCSHPVTRRFTWHAADGAPCVACCDCGAVLAGSQPDNLDQACALSRVRDAIRNLARAMEVSHAV